MDPVSVRVGGDANYPPFQYLHNGKPAGFDIELLEAVAREAGLKVSISLTTWSEARASLTDGKIDMIAGMAYHETRDRLYDFSTPFLAVSFNAFVPNESDLLSLDELAGKRVAVQERAAMQEFLQANQPKARLIPIADGPAVLAQVQQGLVDVGFANNLQGLYLLQQGRFPGIKAVELALPTMNYCFAVRNGNSDLLVRLNQGLSVVRAKGIYDRIHGKWFGSLQPVLTPERMRNLIIIVTLFGLIAVFAVLWSWMLRRQVRLKTSELRQVLDLVPHLICARDKQGRILLANKAMGDALGRSVADLIGTKDDTTAGGSASAADGPLVESGMEAVMIRESLTSDEGEEVLLQTTRMPLIDPDGGSRGVLTVSVDVTQQVRAEQELRVQNERLALLNEIAALAVSSRTVSDLAERLSETLQGILHYDSYYLYSYDESNGRLAHRAGLRPAPDGLHRTSLPPAEITATILAHTDELVTDRRVLVLGETPAGWAGSMLLAPLVSSGRLTGFLVLAADESQTYGPRAETLLHEIARQIGPALEASLLDERLAENEQQLRGIIDALPDCVCLKDSEGRWLYANLLQQGLWNLSGRSYRGLADAELASSLPEARRPLAESSGAEEAAWNARRPLRSEEVLMDSDGAERAFDVVRVPLYDPDGARRGMVIVRRDISNRRAFELALKQNERRYRTLFELSPSGIIVLSADGRILDANQSASTTLGYAVAELAGQHISILTRAPEELVLGNIDAILQGKVLNHEVRNFGRNGEEYYLELRETRIHLPDGSLGILVILNDITERRRGQDALEASEEMYRLAIEAASGVPYHITYAAEFQDSTYDFIGEGIEALIGLKREEVTFRGFTSLIEEVIIRTPGAPADTKTFHETYWRGEIDRYEADIRVVRPDGAVKWLSDTSVPIRDKQTRRPLSSLGILMDITERKFAEEQRQRMETQVLHSQKLESLGVMAGGIAHDFNNLLVGILGNVDLARDELPAMSDARSIISEIEVAAKRAAELCRQLLAYSGKGRFVVEPLDLNHLVREMSHLLELSISKTASLHFDLQPDPPAVEADATQIRQVVMNLIINASEAMSGRPGVVTVRTFHADSLPATGLLMEPLRDGQKPVLRGYVALSVSDTGVGMDKATLARIFDPFFTTKFTGRGLGLAAVQGIIRGHEGAVTVVSKPREGTTFTIYLPASTAAAAPAHESRPPAELWQALGTVMVADDEAGVRAVARRILQRAGLEVIEAVDGLDAVNRVRERGDGIACIVLDLTMPRMSGEDALAEIRKLSPGMRVILSSGFSEQDVYARFAGFNISGFVQKPYKATALADAVRKVLEEKVESMVRRAGHS